MTTSSILILLKSDFHKSTGFILWLLALGTKIITLPIIAATTTKNEECKRNAILLLAANVNIPMQTTKFLELSSNDEPNFSRFFLFVWIISGMESVVRLICTCLFTSEEVFLKMFYPFNIQSYICLVILLEFLLLLIWHLFFKYLYLWRNLIILKPKQSVLIA